MSSDLAPADILVVDDIPDNLRLLSNMLSKQGHRVRTVLSGRMALTVVETDPPNLILLDINMPQMNGYEVCRKLKTNPRTQDIPVIFISALGDTQDKVKAFSAGGSDYITKPFQVEEVVARVNNQLHNRYLQHQLQIQNVLLQKKIKEHERALQQRRQVEEEIRLLLNLTQVIHKARDFYSALGSALRTICTTTGWNYGEAWIPSADRTGLECAPAWYCNHSEISRDQIAQLREFREYSEGLVFLPDEGLPGRVWSLEEAKWITDISAASDVLALREQVAQDVGLKAALGVPIMSAQTSALSTPQEEELGGDRSHPQRQVLAILVFFMLASRHQDHHLVDLITAVSSQLGNAVQQKQVVAELRALFAAMTDIILVVDAQGNCLRVAPTNPLKSYKPPQDLIGKNLHDIFEPTQADQFVEYIWETLNRQETVTMEYSLEVEGEETCFAGTISPISEDSVIWVARDITEQKQAQEALRLEQEALRLEKEKSESLLLNILPEVIAEQLKQSQDAIADQFDEVTILFGDIVQFTPISAQMPPRELVDLLNLIFSAFDHLADRHGLEKIKTIGDEYMVVGGLPVKRPDHAEAIAQMALDMQQAMTQFRRESGEPFQLRIGINTGPVIAGVIGIKKFTYDLWGDTVNVASRMESHAEPSSIQVSAETYEHLKHRYRCERRGKIEIKGKGEMETYWLKGKK